MIPSNVEAEKVIQSLSDHLRLKLHAIYLINTPRQYRDNYTLTRFHYDIVLEVMNRAEKGRDESWKSFEAAWKLPKDLYEIVLAATKTL